MSLRSSGSDDGEEKVMAKLKKPAVVLAVNGKARAGTGETRQPVEVPIRCVAAYFVQAD